MLQQPFLSYPIRLTVNCEELVEVMPRYACISKLMHIPKDRCCWDKFVDILTTLLPTKIVICIIKCVYALT